MSHLSRRGVIVGAACSLPTLAFAADKTMVGTEPSVISKPPRQFGPGAPPLMDPDPDILAIDPSFHRLLIDQAMIHRVYTGLQWAEGPAWCAAGRYALFSDVKANKQYRYLWETKEFTVFRNPSYNSNGNTFDFDGRQVSCQDFFRRVVRWEHDGSMTVVADNYQGQPLNSPNDLAPHPDGSIWFSDPFFGAQLSEGHTDAAGGPLNKDGRYNPKLGAGGTGLIGSMRQVLPYNFYRCDKDGTLTVVVPGEKGLLPNGICFSPDYKKVYLVRSGSIWVADVTGKTIANLRVFTDCVVDGIKCGPDGMRADTLGNIWAGSASVLGYAGVTVWNPAGKLIGRIRLPEVCANLCFAGPKRDWLFMTASQSIYMLRTNIQGAAPG